MCGPFQRFIENILRQTVPLGSACGDHQTTVEDAGRVNALE